MLLAQSATFACHSQNGEEGFLLRKTTAYSFRKSPVSAETGSGPEKLGKVLFWGQISGKVPETIGCGFSQ